MTLKDLATLYDERVANLYRYDKNDFPNGEPLYQNKLKPGPMGDSIKFDSQSMPITSAIRDVERMAKFTISGKGLLFLAEQQLLQSGNSFTQTAIINPAFVVANAVPFIHLSRNLSSITGTPDTIRGRLQATTHRAASKVAREQMLAKPGYPAGFDSRQRAIRAGDGGGPLDALLGGITGTIDNIVSGAQSLLSPSSVADGVDQRPDIDNFNSLLEDKSTADKIADAGSTALSAALNLSLGILPSAPVAPAQPSFEPVGKVTPLFNVRRDYDALENPTAKVRTYNDYRQLIRTMYSSKPNPITGKSEISYFNDQNMTALDKDGLLPNKVTGIEYTQTQLDQLYKFTGTKDFIDVFVGVPSKGKKVQFRAFIKDIKHSSKPEYAATRYIGRTEKYVTYSGTSRVASFALTLAAFSQEEMDGMYAKLNYLIGLTYPLGVATGTNAANPLMAPQLLQPPMVTLTIGKIFVSQPGYFETVSVQYGETYDLDKQLPMMATILMSYIILEKETMFYTNPTIGAFQNDPPANAKPPVPDPAKPTVIDSIPYISNTTTYGLV